MTTVLARVETSIVAFVSEGPLTVQHLLLLSFNRMLSLILSLNLMKRWVWKALLGTHIALRNVILGLKLE